MKRTVISLLVLAGIACTALALSSLYHLGVAHAQGTGSSGAPPLAVPPDIDSDAAGFVEYAYSAATSGHWKVFFGAVLLSLTWLIRRSPIGTWAPWFKTRLGGFVLAFGLALGGTYGLAFATGAAITPLLALDAFVTTGLAAGLWQWLQLQLAPKPEQLPSGEVRP